MKLVVSKIDYSILCVFRSLINIFLMFTSPLWIIPFFVACMFSGGLTEEILGGRWLLGGENE